MLVSGRKDMSWDDDLEVLADTDSYNGYVLVPSRRCYDFPVIPICARYNSSLVRYGQCVENFTSSSYSEENYSSSSEVSSLTSDYIRGGYRSWAADPPDFILDAPSKTTCSLTSGVLREIDKQPRYSDDQRTSTTRVQGDFDVACDLDYFIGRSSHFCWDKIRTFRIEVTYICNIRSS